MARGEAVFEYWCATCHSPGPGMPGTQALQAKYNGTLPAVLTERADLTPALISFYVRNGISVMPFFRKTEVSDADLEALAAYVVGVSKTWDPTVGPSWAWASRSARHASIRA